MGTVCHIPLTVSHIPLTVYKSSDGMSDISVGNVYVAYVILGVNIAQIDLKMTRGVGSSRRERGGRKKQ